MRRFPRLILVQVLPHPSDVLELSQDEIKKVKKRFKKAKVLKNSADKKVRTKGDNNDLYQ